MTKWYVQIYEKGDIVKETEHESLDSAREHVRGIPSAREKSSAWISTKPEKKK